MKHHHLAAISMTILLAAQSSFAGAKDIRLELRNKTAESYMNPGSHLKFARYHFDSGNKMQAFYIAEYTREMFGDEAFDEFFPKVACVKLQVAPEFSNKDDLVRYCQAHTNSFLAFLEKWKAPFGDEEPTAKQNEQFIKEACLRFPNQYEVKCAAAKYYLTVAKDEDKALPLYLDLYFHNPHYYDWEYAEFRIKQISANHKATWWKERLESTNSLEQIVANEKNPRVLDIAINDFQEHWDPSSIPAILKMLSNDDPNIQSRALHTLLAHPNDLSPYADQIRSMVKGDDFVMRAIGAFLVVTCLDDKEYDLLKDNLDSGIELIQLDTIQALSSMGGEKGKAFLKANPPQKATGKMMKFWKEQSSE